MTQKYSHAYICRAHNYDTLKNMIDDSSSMLMYMDDIMKSAPELAEVVLILI